MFKYTKYILLFVFILLGFFAKATLAEAASRFWVGGTGNWDASDTTHWAASSGGGGGASVPGSGDTVTLDGSSGGGMVTVTAAVNVTSITMGAFTGTLDLNGQTIDVVTFSLTGTGTRTLTMGASAINVSGTGSAWFANTMTNCTITANTATLTFTGADPVFGGASGTNWNGLSLVVNSSGTFNLSADAPTFANITRTGAANKTSVFTTGRYTVTGTLTLAGNSTSYRLLVQSNTYGTRRTITNTGATMAWSYVDFQDMDVSTAYDCSGITGGCGDAGNNTDITFTTSDVMYWTGNGGNWDDATQWCTSSGGCADNSGDGRIPLPQDDVVFDNSSFNSTGQNVYSPTSFRFGRDIDWSGYNEGQSPTWDRAGGTSYGSVSLSPDISLGGSGNTYTLAGRGSHTITSNGKEWNYPLDIRAIGGTYTMQDAYLNSNTGSGGSITITNGTLSTNYNVTVAVVTVSSGTTVVMGSGTWTLIRSSAGTVWTGTGTITPDTSTILITNTGTAAKTFAGGGKTYNNLTITADNVIITGNNTFSTLNLNNPGYTNGTKFTGTSTTTITSLFSTNATTTAARVVATSTNASIYELNFTGGGTVCVDYMTFARTLGKPASTWYVGANSSDVGNNSGLTFTACPGGGATSTESSVQVRGGVKARGGVKFR